jgi:glycosyltransferase involved in cell wall biosynthesis
MLLRHPINRGLGQSRNTAIDVARGEFVFLLDADNSVFPSGIGRLVRAIEDDPEAAFAWGYLQTHDPELQPVGLLSSFDWEPARFGNGNYIDAMVLWRRAALLDWGMYTTDSGLYGWEDFELFARVAEGGGHGVMTPQFVARYRLSGLSMLRTANMASDAMTRQLIEMYPTAMGASLYQR